MNIKKNNSNQNHLNPQRDGKRYPLAFLKPNGSKGDYCFYMNYAIDTYRSGCYNDCLYCFARSINQNIHKSKWKPNDVSIIDTESIDRQFRDAFETSKKATKITSILRQRIPIKIGRNSDPFHPIEKHVRATYETLEIFNRYHYPYILSTKSDMVADERYLKLYDPEITYVQMTVTTLNEVLGKKMEQNAVSPFKRIDAVKKLSQIGVKSAFRIQPLFPIYPDGTLSSGYSNQNNVKSKYFSFDLVDELIKAKPHCIIAGFLKFYSSNIYMELSNIGMDIVPFYRLNKRCFSPREMTRYFKIIKEKCDNSGVNFSVCYDKAQNFEKFRYMWANQEDCCCAKGMIKEFTKTARDVQ
jgi:DNA repair photolyase